MHQPLVDPIIILVLVFVYQVEVTKDKPVWVSILLNTSQFIDKQTCLQVPLRPIHSSSSPGVLSLDVQDLGR
jgi:hypothetical protein